MSRSTLAQNSSKRNLSFDLMKLALAVLVVMIHSEVDTGLLTPLLWVSVPLFFMTSGYFFFGKINRAGTNAERSAIFRKFIKRNMQLYGFWFVVLLPVTLYIRDWFSGSLLTGAVDFVQSFLFNSTYRGSWYIMALNISVGLVLWASSRMKTHVLLMLSAPVYLLCCLFSNYYGLIADNAVVTGLYEGYLTVFLSLNNGFPAGLFWVVLGKLLAEREIALKRGRLLAAAAVFSGLLVAEHMLVEYFHLAKTHNAYLLLIPLCTAVFSLVRKTEISAEKDVRPGQISTILYAAHASVVSVVGAVLRRITALTGNALQWTVFLLTILLCTAVCFVIFFLEKRKGFGWLRYSY